MQSTSSPKPPTGMVEGKKTDVRRMFDAIAPRYDLLNRVLSGGIDQSWRRKLIRRLVQTHPERVLDVATGTGDLAIMAAEAGIPNVVGVDIAEEMLAVGHQKVIARGLSENVVLRTGDAEKLPFSDRQFDAGMVAFGVRNFEDLKEGLNQFFRVLKPGGRLFVLEFSKPRTPGIKQVYNLYGRTLLPAMGRMISGNAAAYTYLPESINVFPEGEAFLTYLTEAGFVDLGEQRLTFGIATLYEGSRPLL